MAKKIRIIKNGYYAVVSEDLLKTATVKDYVYEHRLIAEEMLGRPLLEDEEVHHLDNDRLNNSTENLLVLSGTMHRKLHKWLEKNVITPKYPPRPKTLLCKTCGEFIERDSHYVDYCSDNCYGIGRRKVEWPSKEDLAELMKTTSMVKIGQDFGVSDKAVKKWCIKYGLT